MTACGPLCAPLAGGVEILPLSIGSGRIWAAVPTIVEGDLFG